MKIKTVTANNRKKSFEVTTAGDTYAFPYALLRVQPDATNRVAEVFPDDELGREAFTYRLSDGEEDTVTLTQALCHRMPPLVETLRILRS